MKKVRFDNTCVHPVTLTTKQDLDEVERLRDEIQNEVIQSLNKKRDNTGRHADSFPLCSDSRQIGE
jgi:hypothetical protein